MLRNDDDNNNGRRDYDNKENPEISDFGRRDKDVIINKEKLYNMFWEMRDEITKVQITMNNGIVEAVERLGKHTNKNTNEIKKLRENIQNMEIEVNSQKSYSKGGENKTNKIIAWSVGIGGWLIALLAFLFGNGVISI